MERLDSAMLVRMSARLKAEVAGFAVAHGLGEAAAARLLLVEALAARRRRERR